MNYSEKSLRESFSPAYQLELKYGFYQIDTAFKKSRLVKSASEYTFFSNLSSHMKPRSWGTKGLTTDNWRFGFGFANGWGWQLSKNVRLVLTHSGNLVWSHIDIEQTLSDKNEQKQLDSFDDLYKFGNSYSSGISFIFGSIALNTDYEHNVIFPVTLGGKWLGSASFELLLQRSIDYFAQEMIDRNSFFAPILIFTSKTLVSTFLYEMKRTNSFFPFSSPASLNYSGNNISITYIF